MPFSHGTHDPLELPDWIYTIIKALVGPVFLPLLLRLKVSPFFKQSLPSDISNAILHVT